MLRALEWLGLDWDGVERQSDHGQDHAAALDRLAEAGWLYPCTCSRAEMAAQALSRAPDGSLRYPGTCRHRALPAADQGGWRGCDDAIRLRLPPGRIQVLDEDGSDLSQDPAAECGDPVVRRRDGAVAYPLASVVDDARIGVSRVVRGRDLAPTTAVQVAIAQLLGGTAPGYRHHLLLLEERGGKLAKLHGAVGFEALSARYSGGEFCGLLAEACGLRPRARAVHPAELLAGFRWDQVRAADRTVTWDGQALGLGA